MTREGEAGAVTPPLGLLPRPAPQGVEEHRTRPAIRAGTLIGRRFRLTSIIAIGGCGAVWRAHDESLGRDVAIKQASCAHGGRGDQGRPLREAQVAARVNHAATITVHDLFVEDGHTWIVMELIEGETLQRAVERHGSLPVRRVAAIGRQVLSALRVTHAAGFVHCDVKPSNILLARDDRAVLTDFGLATEKDQRASAPCVGSPPYLSPEQALGHPVSAASDLWALGATLYAAIEGRSPYQRDEPLASLLAVTTEEYRASPAAGPLDGVFERLLRKDPAERATAAETARLLERAGAGWMRRAWPFAG